MDRTRRAMTLIEMVVCLAIVAICLFAVVRGYGTLTTLSVRGAEDDVLVEQVEALIVTLEAEAPKVTEGELRGPWQYRTHMGERAYYLEVWHETTGERHQFVLREGPT